MTDRVGTRAPQRRRRTVLLLACTAGVALRAYPLHVAYLHPDQEMIPVMALRAFVAGDWRPTWLVYPSGLMTLLRAFYSVVYVIGLETGRFADRSSLVEAYAWHPYAFFLPARVLSCALGAATIPLAWILGRRLYGMRAANAAAVFLAVTFLHVRESHYGSLDAPATAFWTASLAAAAGLSIAPGVVLALAAGVAGGLAAAFRYQLGTVLFAAPVALLLSRASWPVTRRSLLVYGAAAAAAFTILSPYAVTDVGRAIDDVRAQLRLSFAPAPHESLTLPALMRAAAGTPMSIMAAVGAVIVARLRPAAAVAIAVGVVPYVLSLAAAHRLFARYVVPLTPLVAVFAGVALAAGARRVPPRWRPVAFGLGMLGVALDPAARSLEYDRVLARPDSRREAATWILTNIPTSETVFVVADGWYTVPDLPPSVTRLRAQFGAGVVDRLAGKLDGRAPGIAAYLFDGSALAPEARWVVTSGHPGLPAFGAVPDRIAARLANGATKVFDIQAYDPTVDDALFDPIDANFVPLRGLAAQRRPGPDLAIWRLGPE